VLSERTAYDLLAGDDTALAEVADDRVCGQPLPEGDEVRWREVEVELKDGDEDLLRAAHQRLSELDGAVEGSPAKLFRTLGGVPPTPGLAEPRDAGEPTAVLVQARLGHQVDAVRRWDPLVRERLPGGVHQIRIAVRRLRDGLATARPFLDWAEVGAVRDELEWLAREMGEARDAEVQEARLRGNLEEVGRTSEGSVHTLARISAAAHQDAREALRTDRYLALLARLDDLVASPPWREQSTRSIEDAYLPRVRREWKRLAKRVAAANDADQPTARANALHECRKAAKRLRYAVEPLEPVLGKPAERTRKDAQRLQEILGNHHDAVVARHAAQRLAADASPAESFALGAVLELERARLADVEAEFGRAWKRAKSKKRRGWLG
jgi:CHAD domain-containing protein